MKRIYIVSWLLIGITGMFFMMHSIVAAADKVVVKGVEKYSP